MSTVNSGDYTPTLATIPSTQNSIRTSHDHGDGASSNWQRKAQRGMSRSRNRDCRSSTTRNSNYSGINNNNTRAGLHPTGTINNHINNNNNNNHFSEQQSTKFIVKHHQ